MKTWSYVHDNSDVMADRCGTLWDSLSNTFETSCRVFCETREDCKTMFWNLLPTFAAKNESHRQARANVDEKSPRKRSSMPLQLHELKLKTQGRDAEEEILPPNEFADEMDEMR